MRHIRVFRGNDLLHLLGHRLGLQSQKRRTRLVKEQESKNQECNSQPRIDGDTLPHGRIIQIEPEFNDVFTRFRSDRLTFSGRIKRLPIKLILVQCLVRVGNRRDPLDPFEHIRDFIEIHE